jgi:hypothetical protein
MRAYRGVIFAVAAVIAAEMTVVLPMLAFAQAASPTVPVAQKATARNRHRLAWWTSTRPLWLT